MYVGQCVCVGKKTCDAIFASPNLNAYILAAIVGCVQAPREIFFVSYCGESCLLIMGLVCSCCECGEQLPNWYSLSLLYLLHFVSHFPAFGLYTKVSSF